MALSTRSSISRAAFSVNVRAKISLGLAKPAVIKCFIRSVTTVVLPVPAPAMIRSGPIPNSTACFCSGLSKRFSSGTLGIVG